VAGLLRLGDPVTAPLRGRASALQGAGSSVSRCERTRDPSGRGRAGRRDWVTGLQGCSGAGLPVEEILG
jgi:hypothetical protein